MHANRGACICSKKETTAAALSSLSHCGQPVPVCHHMGTWERQSDKSGTAATTCCRKKVTCHLMVTRLSFISPWGGHSRSLFGRNIQIFMHQCLRVCVCVYMGDKFKKNHFLLQLCFCMCTSVKWTANEMNLFKMILWLCIILCKTSYFDRWAMSRQLVQWVFAHWQVKTQQGAGQEKAGVENGWMDVLEMSVMNLSDVAHVNSPSLGLTSVAWRCILWP